MKKSTSRRTFVKQSTTLGLAISLLGGSLVSCSSEQSDGKVTSKTITPLRILILGGTSFLGPHQIAYALNRGHSISTFTRGKTLPSVHQELFANVEQLIGDREDDLSALENGSWDVVIDNSGRKTEWTQKSAQLLKNKAKFYLYTSSTGVYYPYLKDKISEETKVLLQEPAELKEGEDELDYWYGVMKATSEQETIKAFGIERSIIVRPTYMMGPADKTDRFIYWPIRLAKGGEILVPGKTADPVEYIDVRDVAEWMIRLAEEKLTGTFNAVGPKSSQTMMEFVEEARQAFDVPSSIVQVNDYGFLEENGVQYLIPWIPPTGNYYGSARVNNSSAIKAGLTFRDLKDSLKETHDWWYSDALTDERRNEFEQNPEGLLMRESTILDKWQQL